MHFSKVLNKLQQRNETRMLDLQLLKLRWARSYRTLFKLRESNDIEHTYSSRILCFWWKSQYIQRDSMQELTTKSHHKVSQRSLTIKSSHFYWAHESKRICREVLLEDMMKVTRSAQIKVMMKTLTIKVMLKAMLRVKLEDTMRDRMKTRWRQNEDEMKAWWKTR